MSTSDISHDVSKPVAIAFSRHAHKTNRFHAPKSGSSPVFAGPKSQEPVRKKCQRLLKAFLVRSRVLIRKAVSAMTQLLTIQQVQPQLSLSRSSVYRLIDERQLERVYVGSAPRVISDSVEEFIERLRKPGSIFASEGSL